MRHQRPVIGIVGARGAVGSVAAAAIAESGVGDVRLASRTPAAGRPWWSVDANDPDTLDAFCAGCRLVLNCAGPSLRIEDRVARAALAAGADYVDVGGYEHLHALLHEADAVTGGRTAIVSAGVYPGLSGLLPRLLGPGQLDRVRRMRCWVGAMDAFPAAGAADFLETATRGFGAPGAAWRAGTRRAGVLAPARARNLPLFRSDVICVPYLSAETERLCDALQLDELDWYHAFPGIRTLRVVDRAASHRNPGTDPKLVAELQAAAQHDLAQHRPYLALLAEADGDRDGRPATRSLLFRADDPYRLNGVVAAATAVQVCRGALPPGLHHAADVLTPGHLADLLRSAGDTLVELSAGPVAAARRSEVAS